MVVCFFAVGYHALGGGGGMHVRGSHLIRSLIVVVLVFCTLPVLNYIYKYILFKYTFYGLACKHILMVRSFLIFGCSPGVTVVLVNGRWRWWYLSDAAAVAVASCIICCYCCCSQRTEAFLVVCGILGTFFFKSCIVMILKSVIG